MNSIIVSVIVPVYKIEESLLRRCLSSLMSQSEKSAEFIIVDDGSPDNCGRIIDEYALSDDRIVPVHTENLGVSNARNEGLNRAQGEYIIFVDGDDYVEKDMCEKTVLAIKKADTDILFFMHHSAIKQDSLFGYDESLKVLDEELFRRLIVGVVSQENPIPGVWTGSPWGKVYKRSIINDNNLRFVLGLEKSQDRVFVLDYLLKVKSAALYRYMGYHYIIHESSVCQRYNKNIISTLEMAGNELEERIKNIPDNEIYVRALDTMYMNFFCEYMFLYFFNHDNKSSHVVKVKEMKNLLHNKKYKKALRQGELNTISRKRRLIVLAARYHLYSVSGFLTAVLF